MRKNVIRGELTMGEMRYLIFQKKNCPKCGGKMTKEKYYEIRKGKEFNKNTQTIYAPNVEVKYYRYRFTCNRCGETFLMEDLANQKG